MRKIFYVFESKCYLEMFNNFLSNFFRNTLYNLSQCFFNFLFNRSFFKCLTSWNNCFRLRLIFIICTMFNFSCLLIDIYNYFDYLLTLIFSSCSLILKYSLFISTYSVKFFLKSSNIIRKSFDGIKLKFPGSKSVKIEVIIC